MLHQVESAPTRAGNSQSKIVHVRVPQEPCEETRVDDSSLELRPDLSLRPLTLRFSIAYYISWRL